jgi:hypothetical protein
MSTASRGLRRIARLTEQATKWLHLPGKACCIVNRSAAHGR